MRRIKELVFAHMPIKYRLVSPLLIILVSIIGYPLSFALWISLTDYNLSQLGKTQFIGLTNYRSLLSNQDFLVALANTLFFVTVAVSLEFVLGFAIALLLNHKIVFKNFFRSIFLTPMLLAPVAVALMFRFILNPEFGIISLLFKKMGLGPITWFSHSPLAMLTIIGIDVWQWTPFVMIMLLAGLEALPDELFEAAKVDGASGAQTFFRITVPLLSPVIIIAIIIRMLDAFKVFAKIVAITRGGPGQSTETIAHFIYKTSFLFFKMGEGASMGYTLLVIILGLVALQFVLLRKARFRY